MENELLRERARRAEAGRTTPRPAVMRRIAAALGVDAHQVAEFRRVIAMSGRPR